MSVPPKLALNYDESGDAPVPKNLWVIPWLVENPLEIVPEAYSVHLDAEKAELFLNEHAPEGYRHFEHNFSYVDGITFVDPSDYKSDETGSLVVRIDNARMQYNLKGVAVIRTTTPYLFTQLGFTESMRVGGMMLTKRITDPLRAYTFIVEHALKENGFLPGKEARVTTLDLRLRRPAPDRPGEP